MNDNERNGLQEIIDKAISDIARVNSNPVWYQQSANVCTAGQQSWYRR